MNVSRPFGFAHLDGFDSAGLTMKKLTAGRLVVSGEGPEAGDWGPGGEDIGPERGKERDISCFGGDKLR
jgi:hypothetical protein